MRALLKATLLPVLLLAACHAGPTRPSALFEELQTLKGQKIRVYVIGTVESSLSGTVRDVTPELLTLDYQYSQGKDQPPSRGKYLISMDRISAISVGEH